MRIFNPHLIDTPKEKVEYENNEIFQNKKIRINRYKRNQVDQRNTAGHGGTNL
jgi:hypothetical protein